MFPLWVVMCLSNASRWSCSVRRVALDKPHRVGGAYSFPLGFFVEHHWYCLYMSEHTSRPNPIIEQVSQPLTMDDLPPPNIRRWITRRKAEVVKQSNPEGRARLATPWHVLLDRHDCPEGQHPADVSRPNSEHQKHQGPAAADTKCALSYPEQYRLHRSTVPMPTQTSTERQENRPEPATPQQPNPGISFRISSKDFEADLEKKLPGKLRRGPVGHFPYSVI